MSLDKSLKSKSALERHRNVLTRAERIETLQEEDRWTEDTEPFGLPKVAHRKTSAGAKDKAAAKKAEETEATVTKGKDTSAS
ncbi:MAG TPA: small basic protein [Phycisphaerae bacterium]|nr:small basic protein [Phycisphaerae bacterium]